MIKKIIIALASIVLMGLAVSALKNKEFYTSEQLDTARNKAVDQARDGDFEAALRRLKVLSKYDADNAKVWYDYLTVLHWDGQNDEFFEKLPNIHSTSIPDYFLETSISITGSINTLNKELQLGQLFKFLFASSDFLDSHYFIDLYKASKVSGTDTLFSHLLNQPAIDQKYANEIALYNMVQLARDGKIDQSVELFDSSYDRNKTNPKFIAEYITVNNWARSHDKVISASKLVDNRLLPEHALASIADSHLAKTDLLSSQNYYQLLNETYEENGKYELKLQELDDAIIASEKIKQQQAIQDEKNKAAKLAQEKQLQHETLQKLKEQTFLNLSAEELETKLTTKPFSTKYYNRWNDLAKENNYYTFSSQIPFYEKSLSLHTKDSLFYYNYLVLLSWDGQHDKAIELYKEPSEKFASSYYFKALATSAKHAKKYPLALSLYDKAIALEKGNQVDSFVNKANILQELKQPQEAIDLLSKLNKAQKEEIDVLFSFAGAYRQLGQSLFALSFYDKILSEDLESDRALLNKAITLSEARLPFFAFEILQEHPELFNFEQKLAIYSGMNTYKVKLARDDSEPLEHQVAINEAMITNNGYLQLLQQNIKYTSRTLYAIADKVILLHLDKEYQAALDIYKEKLYNLPNYALNVISSSALAMKLPKQALEVTETVLKTQPNDFNALVNGYYACLELEDFSKAFNYLQLIDEHSGIWLYSSDGKKSIENPSKESVLLLKAMHIAYTNNLGDAQLELENLLDKAPLNSNYRVNLAKIYQWRGWYDKAQEQLNIIANSDPDFITLNNAQASLWLEQKQYQNSEIQLDTLLTMSPIPDSVKLHKKEWDIHNLHILSLSYQQTDTEGSNFASKDETYSASFYSKPINYNWRIYGYYKNTFSRFFSEDDHITTQGLGINYRQTWGDANISLFNVEGKTGQELSIDGTWEINDRSSLSAQYQTFSDDTPVRAFHSNVYAKSLSISGAYYPNEEYRYNGNVDLMDFTDGNQRTSLGLSAYQPLYRDEHHIISIWEYAYAQHNSKDTNREYFNPKSLYSISGALDYTGIVRRKYDDVFTHSARIGFGYTKQENFSAKPFVDFAYLHRWDISRHFHLYYGIGFRQNYYDGQRENGPNYKAGLEYKF